MRTTHLCFNAWGLKNTCHVRVLAVPGVMACATTCDHKGSGPLPRQQTLHKIHAHGTRAYDHPPWFKLVDLSGMKATNVLRNRSCVEYSLVHHGSSTRAATRGITCGATLWCNLSRNKEKKGNQSAAISFHSRIKREKKGGSCISNLPQLKN